MIRVDADPAIYDAQNMMKQLFYTHHDSPVGPLFMAGAGDELHVLSFPTGHKKRGPGPNWVRDDSILSDARDQLDSYFAGELTEFELNLKPEGSRFQLAIWSELTKIPYGQTVSYGEIAKRIGQPVSVSRAVGAANGDNPIPIVIPCHRVIGADGSLTGFGGGLETKKFLLDLEDKVRPSPGKQFSLFG